MKRTTKIERKENAIKFYNMLMEGNCNSAVIVVERPVSNNPNICKCRFLAVTASLAFMEFPIVIAESAIGITGCFMELLDNIKPEIKKQKSYKTYYDDGFNDWLKKTFEFRIGYNDGFVIMLQRIG